MCSLLFMFTVVGAVELSPGAMLVQTLNDGVIEEYVVPTEQYQSCYTSQHFGKKV